jgi:hypothetical protein
MKKVKEGAGSVYQVDILTINPRGNQGSHLSVVHYHLHLLGR